MKTPFAWPPSSSQYWHMLMSKYWLLTKNMKIHTPPVLSVKWTFTANGKTPALNWGKLYGATAHTWPYVAVKIAQGYIKQKVDSVHDGTKPCGMCSQGPVPAGQSTSPSTCYRFHHSPYTITLLYTTLLYTITIPYTINLPLTTLLYTTPHTPLLYTTPHTPLPYHSPPYYSPPYHTPPYYTSLPNRSPPNYTPLFHTPLYYTSPPNHSPPYYTPPNHTPPYYTPSAPCPLPRHYRPSPLSLNQSTTRLLMKTRQAIYTVRDTRPGKFLMSQLIVTWLFWWPLLALTRDICIAVEPAVHCGIQTPHGFNHEGAGSWRGR